MTRVTRLNPRITASDRPLRRPPRNTTVSLGDSIAAFATGGRFYQPYIGDSYFNLMVGDSLQRIQYQGVYAQSGYTLTQIRDTYLPYVLALSPKPGACFVMGGTNDCANVGTTFSLAYSSGVLQQIVSQLLNTGIAPILTTAPPAHGGGVTTFLANTQKWNTWVKRYAATNGFPLMDVYGAVAGPNGFYKSGFDNGGDGIHPGPLGRRAIADQSLANGIADLFPPNGGGGFLTSKSTADLTNMLNNGTINEGLHTVDTNADGVADGYTLDGGSSTLTVVAPTTADNLVGNWQQIALPSLATNYARLRRIFSTGWSVGDTLSFSARVQTDNMIATAAPFYVTAVQDNASYVTPGGVSDPNPRSGWVAWTTDVDGLVYVEFPILAGTTGLSVQILISNPVNAGIPRLRVGEVTLRNLTTGGLLI